MAFEVEVTDTFGGEANYSWVRRYTLDLPADASRVRVIRAAKKAAGWTGRTTTEEYGDTYTVRPPATVCMVMFVTFNEGEGVARD